MKPIDVNSDIKLIEHVFLKLIDLKDDCSKRISNLEMNFNNELKAFESSRSTLYREKDNAVTKENFVIEARTLLSLVAQILSGRRPVKLLRK